MKVITAGWLSVFAAILVMNIYIWHCYWKIPFRKSKRLKTLGYGVVHITLAALSVFYFQLFFSGKTDSKLAEVLSYIAGFYLTFLHYSVLMYAVHDLVVFLGRVLPYPEKLRNFGQRVFFGGFVIFGIAAAISVLGIINAGRLAVKTYDISIAAQDSNIEELNIVYIADAHIGTSVTADNISDIVERANELNPDIVIFGGDFFDEGTTTNSKIESAKKLAEISSKYGTYCVEGNHEYKSGDSNINNQMKYFSDAGISVLQDESIIIADSFYLIGRKDKHGDIKELSELTHNIEDLPVILVDHRPSFKESSANGKISLQLSGHSHSGQFFPMQIFDPLLSKITKSYNYGYHHGGGMPIVVSSGVGNWGIPVRLGSEREIVQINLSFK